MFLGVTHSWVGWRELLQHVWDDDLQQSLSEELLAHCAAVVIIFLTGKEQKHNVSTTHYSFYTHCTNHIYCWNTRVPLEINKIYPDTVWLNKPQIDFKVFSHYLILKVCFHSIILYSVMCCSYDEVTVFTFCLSTVFNFPILPWELCPGIAGWSCTCHRLPWSLRTGWAAAQMCTLRCPFAVRK